MANNSNLSKRAALRQQQEMEERNKRTKRIMMFGLGRGRVLRREVHDNHGAQNG